MWVVIGWFIVIIQQQLVYRRYMKNLSLFMKEDLPRHKPIKRMHVIDAGHNCIEMKCFHCGYESGWINDERKTITELKRGLPCPECNQQRERIK